MTPPVHYSSELKSLQNQLTALTEEQDNLSSVKEQLQNDLEVCKNKLNT
jgi:uncharacterized protein YoxC